MSPTRDPKSVVRAGYDAVSRRYRADDAADGAYAEAVVLIEEYVVAGAPILDLGCGCGVPVARRLSLRYAVTGIDFSPVQIGRARTVVPAAVFMCADMTTARFDDASFDAVVCLYALIHVPLAEQLPLLHRVARWLRPGGAFVATVGDRAWTGVEHDWLGVKGADMWWSHADAATYRQWLREVGLRLELERSVPEGDSRHTFVFATK
ncbi:MAG: class I SAM-dependent methyltransferase [Chloroflexota bacterium]|nr:class I SAM-dependent methyltransferase [Chloroflexota bacterium]